MRFCGMKHPAAVKVRLPEKEQTRERRNKWVYGDFGKFSKFKPRQITEVERPYNVRGYRIDKPGLQEPIFVQKWTTAVLVYCAGIFKSPGKFSGRGGRIEAVR